MKKQTLVSIGMFIINWVGATILLTANRETPIVWGITLVAAMVLNYFEGVYVGRRLGR